MRNKKRSIEHFYGSPERSQLKSVRAMLENEDQAEHNIFEGRREPEEEQPAPKVDEEETEDKPKSEDQTEEESPKEDEPGQNRHKGVDCNSGIWLFTDRESTTHFFKPNFLPPYNTPSKRKIILDVLREEWDENTLSWKPCGEGSMTKRPDAVKKITPILEKLLPSSDNKEEADSPNPLG
jgi:hypothetical protein